VKKKIHIIYTGGTIGMKKLPEGYAPVAGHLSQELKKIEELYSEQVPDFTLREFAPLLDSANMNPSHWQEIADEIGAKHEEYDGFVVLHGTDTMAYTASALAFMLEGLQKTVIVTGSQIPLGEIRSDGRTNLLNSLLIAADYRIPEVCVYFNDKLLRGCRTIKLDSESLDAFESPNYPPLGNVGIEIKINNELLLKPRKHPLRVVGVNKTSIAAFRLFPGVTPEILENILRPPLQGLVLETYGRGNGPDQYPEILAVLKQACTRGVVIVATTQCLRGKASLGKYASGSALAKSGVVGGEDMTTEAALAKLNYLFSLKLSPEEIRKWIGSDICGEITADSGSGLTG